MHVYEVEIPVTFKMKLTVTAQNDADAVKIASEINWFNEMRMLHPDASEFLGYTAHAKRAKLTDNGRID